jgi:broad specificity phosphatase PhoE
MHEIVSDEFQTQGSMSRSPRIVLARHGRPDLPADLRRAMSGRDIGRWYRGYDEAGIVEHVGPSLELRAVADAAGCIVASDARRARESAARLTTSGRVRIDPILREVGFPETIGVGVPLSPNAWVLIARGLQLLRRCEGDEPVPATRARAVLAAETLSRLADEHRMVLVVGHGWFNRFIGRELRRCGWTGPRWLPTAYWSSASYERAAGARVLTL